MRLLLAAAVLASAALPLGSAHAASEGSCLDPLLVSSAPHFVYYNPEIGGYYVDVTAAQAWIGAQPGRATAVANCLATLAPSTNGCVSQFLQSDYPNGDPIVTLSPTGGIVIDPHAEDAFVAAAVGNASALVACIV